MNNKRVDRKDQNYPPHACVSDEDVVSGGIFRLEGKAFNADGDVAIVFLTCRAA